METLALKTLSAAETTMLFSTEPIFGGACAAAVLGEQFGLGGFIGAAMVLSGCIASNIGTNDGDD
jgi:drug/metabolite transporter (DMT)-like permease